MSLQMSPYATKPNPITHKKLARQKIGCHLEPASCKMAVQRGSKSNFYQVLSLDNSESVGFDEIKKAYRRMALQYPPDVCPSMAKEESTKRFVELQQAYETLSDPVSRKMYDYEVGFDDSLGPLCGEEGRRRDCFPKKVWEELFGNCNCKNLNRVYLAKKYNSNMRNNVVFSLLLSEFRRKNCTSGI